MSDIIESRYLIPKGLSKLRDYHIFNKLIDELTVSIKSYIDDYPNLLNPKTCPEKFLPYLSGIVGYDYDPKLQTSITRVIIENFMYLIRNRGTDIGFKLALSLSINSLSDPSMIDQLSNYHVERVKNTNPDGTKSLTYRLYIYYSASMIKMFDLIEVVRPIGAIIEIVPVITITSTEQIIVSDLEYHFGYNYRTGMIITCNGYNILINEIDGTVQNICSVFKYNANNAVMDEVVMLRDNNKIYKLSDSSYSLQFLFYDEGGIGRFYSDPNNLYKGDFNDDTVYNVNDLVNYNFSIYKCINEINDPHTFDATDWELQTPLTNRYVGLDNNVYDNNDNRLGYYYDRNKIEIISLKSGNFELSNFYIDNESGNIIDLAGNTVLLNVDHYQLSNTNRVNYSEVTGVSENPIIPSYYRMESYKGIFDTNSTYVTGDRVVYNGNYYESIVDITNPGVFNKDEWEDITNSLLDL